MSVKINPRYLAVKALCKVDREGAYSNIALNSFLREYELSRENKALFTSIFYGTLDRKITIDYILKQFIKSGFNKIKPFTLNLLRSAVYQIKYMDKIPVSATVNESVNIIKSSNESYNARFVNAVLRNILRNETALPSTNSTHDISVRYSCPEWIVESLVNDYSIDIALRFLEHSLLPPPTFIRVNTHKTTVGELSDLLKDEDVSVRRVGLENTLLMSEYSSIESLNAYKQGLFYVQDLSCQHAISLLDIQDNDRIFDMCAAPGGKTFTAANFAQGVSVVATDIYERRVQLINAGLKRLGIINVITAVCDATAYKKEFGLFDKVICDVPCSGLGVLCRKPDIKYKEMEDLESLSEIQFKILCNATNYIKDNGKILYSTCTLRKSENEDIINRFLECYSNYKLVNMKTYFPHLDNSDGFFAAVLQKD